MNNQQLAELQQDVVAALRTLYNDDSFTVSKLDVGAGIEIARMKHAGLRQQILKQLLEIGDRYKAETYVFANDGELTIQMMSEENGGLTDEENAPHDAFEKYQADGGPLTYEEWAKENGVE